MLAFILIFVVSAFSSTNSNLSTSVGFDQATYQKDACYRKQVDAAKTVAKKYSQANYVDCASGSCKTDIYLSVVPGMNHSSYIELPYGPYHGSFSFSPEKDSKNCAYTDKGLNDLVPAFKATERMEILALHDDDAMMDYNCPIDRSSSKAVAGTLASLEPDDAIVISKDIKVGADDMLGAGLRYKNFYFQDGNRYQTRIWFGYHTECSPGYDPANNNASSFFEELRDSSCAPKKNICVLESHNPRINSFPWEDSGDVLMRATKLQVSSVERFKCPGLPKLPADGPLHSRANLPMGGVRIRIKGDPNVARIDCFGQDVGIDQLSKIMGSNFSVVTHGKNSALESNGADNSLGAGAP